MGELRSMPPASVGVILKVHRSRRGVPGILPTTGQMSAPLQPVVGVAQKVPENCSLLVGAGDCPHHQQVWGGYEHIHIIISSHTHIILLNLPLQVKEDSNASLHALFGHHVNT